jgi:hypothetical protein
MIHHVRKTQQSILGSISIFLSESVHEHLNFVYSMYFSSIFFFFSVHLCFYILGNVFLNSFFSTSLNTYLLNNMSLRTIYIFSFEYVLELLFTR